MREALLERMSEQRDGKVSRAEVAFEQFDNTQDDPGLINSQRDLAFAIEHKSCFPPVEDVSEDFFALLDLFFDFVFFSIK